MKALLTPDQVAGILRLSRRKVLSLQIPRIRVGNGRGKVLFSEDDVSNYLSLRTEYPGIKGDHHATGLQRRSKKVGVQGLPSRNYLQKIRVGHEGGGDTSRSGVPH
jgi:hypothetical protein